MKTQLVALLTAGLILPAQSLASDPSRFFDSEESSRYKTEQLPYQPEFDNRFDDEPIITIKKFDLSALPDMPHYGISNKELNDLALADIEDNKGRYTIDRLNQFTDVLTRHYRKHGLLLARTYIPEQNIENATVTVSLVTGTIEALTTTPFKSTKPVTDLYSEDTLTRPFQRLIGSPSYRPDLEASIIRLSRYPGLKTTPRFKAGSSPGATTIDIEVKEQKRFDGYLSFDNHGSEYTGLYRLMANGNINNISDNADRLSFGLMATIDPSNSYYGNLLYKLPIEAKFSEQGYFNWLNPVFKNGFTFDTGIQQSTYTIGQELEDLNIKGDATTLFYSLSKPFIINNETNLTSSVRMDLKTANSEQNGFSLAKDKLTVLTIDTSYQFKDYLYERASNVFSLAINQGLESTLGSMANGDENSRQGPETGFAPADFLKYKLQYRRLQDIDAYQLVTDFSYSHSDDMLLPVEQITLGGPYAVRGYTSADYSADKAFQTTIEIKGKSYAEKLSLPIDHFTAALFVDYAIGWRNDAFANETDSMHLLAAGWYADFVKEEKFHTRMQMGLPLSELKPANDSSVQFFISMQRRF